MRRPVGRVGQRTWTTSRLEFLQRGHGDRGGAAEEPGPGGGRGFPEHSESTVSRTFRYFRPVVAAVLTKFVPDVATACAGEIPLVDGTLVPTGNRAGQPELYSGQRHRAGVTVQVLAT